MSSVHPDLTTAHLIRTRAGAALRHRLRPDRRGAGHTVPMSMGPGAGTVAVPRRIGRWRTFWLCTTGAGLDADTVLSWGLVDEISVGR